jgi:hypothetical protein
MSGIFDDSEYATEAEAVLSSVEVSSQEETQDSILSEAIARIEEANLWRTLVTQEVFPEGSARDEIRQRANAKLKMIGMKEIADLLGMSSKSGDSAAPASLPFSSDEIENLKFLSTLDSEQIRALHVLVNKVLKRDVPPPTQESTYVPRVNSIKPQEVSVSASVRQVKTAQQAVPPAPTVKKADPRRKNKGQTRPSGGIKPLPMVSAEEQIMKGAIRATPPIVGGDAMATNLIGSVVQSLTQGNIIANAGSAPGEDDPNERF